jgi:hypothetical protein
MRNRVDEMEHAMRPLTLLSAGLATCALAAGYVIEALWAGAGIAVVIGLLWLAGDARNWDWVAEPCLAGWVGLAAFGAWWGTISGWMLLGLIAALAAWDLRHFATRLRDAGTITAPNELAHIHLRRLALVAAAGLLFGGIALGMRVELTFGWALLAAALAIIGLSHLISAGGREEQ